MQQRIIAVVDYDIAWPERFEKEARAISGVLAQEIVRMHHIGSTAVPGLKAKPVIDILLEAKNVDDLDAYDSDMQVLEYIPKGEFGIVDRRLYIKGLYERTFHIHAFNAGSQDVLRHLAFRDYLIAFPIVASEYGDLKLGCAAECENDSERYCDCKHDFVREHEGKALQWWGSCNR